MLHLEYTLTKEEFQENIYFCNWLDPDRKADRLKYYRGQIFTVSVMYCLLVFGFRHSRNLYLLIGLLVIGLLFFVYLLSAGTKDLYYGISEKLITKEGGEETILERRDVQIDETGISVKTSKSHLKYNWSGIIRKTRHKDFTYLFVGPRDVIVIPDRVFIDSKEKLRFDDYLSQYLSLSADFVTN